MFYAVVQIGKSVYEIWLLFQQGLNLSKLNSYPFTYSYTNIHTYFQVFKGLPSLHLPKNDHKASVGMDS